MPLTKQKATFYSLIYLKAVFILERERAWMGDGAEGEEGEEKNLKQTP